MTEPTRLTDEALERLLALAELATAGERRIFDGGEPVAGDPHQYAVMLGDREDTTLMLRADADYIAAASPDVVRALAEEVTRLRKMETAVQHEIDDCAGEHEFVGQSHECLLCVLCGVLRKMLEASDAS